MRIALVVSALSCLFVLKSAHAEEAGIVLPDPEPAEVPPQQATPVDARRERRLTPEALRGAIQAAAKREGLHPALIHAMIKEGSYYNQYQVSPDGRLGLMQISPEMAHRMGVSDVFEPEENIRVGARQLRLLIDEFESVRLALVAYRESPALVRSHDAGARPTPATQMFVLSVLRAYRNQRVLYMQVQ